MFCLLAYSFLLIILGATTGSFNWLVDSNVIDNATSTPTPHPLFSAASRIIQVVSETEITVNFSSFSEPLRYEPTVYLRSFYEWMYDFASYSFFDVESGRRMVCLMLQSNFILILLFSLRILRCQCFHMLFMMMHCLLYELILVDGLLCHYVHCQ